MEEEEEEEEESPVLKETTLADLNEEGSILFRRLLWRRWRKNRCWFRQGLLC